MTRHVRLLITGGAGFVGSHMAMSFRRRYPDADIVAFDNLRRRGSEMNLRVLREHGITFVHGDVRRACDLDELPGEFDVMIEASADPSVHAGTRGSPAQVLDINLTGTLVCLEFCRRRVRDLIFLSTSRVYSIAPLRSIALTETRTRFEPQSGQTLPGITAHGIDERFPVHEPRSFYGASKLASELVIQEYVAATGLRAVVNRCGVIAGPGQFGRVDQGVFTLWVAHHVFGQPLRYTGFGGTGRQVRDLLHPEDLAELVDRQLAQMPACSGQVYNVGGGPAQSTSLQELTTVCQAVTGHHVAITSDPETASVDVPWYVTDARKAQRELGWRPVRDVRTIVQEIHTWIRDHERDLRPLFA